MLLQKASIKFTLGRNRSRFWSIQRGMGEYMSADLEQLKHAPASTGIHELIAERWSPRAYSDKAVSTEDLHKIFTAASWAASSSNEQPWRFLVGHKGDEVYAKIFDCLVEFNQKWAKSAPVLILTIAKTIFSKDGSINAWALHDTGAASANMCLQAIALGIHTHGMAGYDKDKVRTHFNLPAEYTEGAVWAMGYLGDPETLPDYMKKMELVPRSRKPLDEIVFSEFGTPAKF
jgi:nitroreductase